MLKVFFVVALTIFISSGYGIFVNKFLNLKEKSYSAPIGFASLLFTLQIFYYPIQLFNQNSLFIHIISTIIFFILTVYSFYNIKSIIKQFLNLRTILIFITFTFFLYVFYNMSISIPRADGQMYLNYIAQNVDAKQLNLFNLWTGLEGSEFVTIYLFQGYYHFGSFLIKFVNAFSSILGIGSKIDYIVISIWGLGSIYSIISTLFIINVVDYFKYKSRLISYILLFFTLFYTNFYYWKVAFAFYGNTFRSLFMAMMIFYLFKLIRESEEKYLYLASIIFGASIAASSSSLFIGFSILIGIAYHFYKENNIYAFQHTSYIGLPMVIYVLAIVFKDYNQYFVFLFIFTVLYYMLHKNKLFERYLTIMNRYISKHVNLIFLIIIPLIAITYSFIDMNIHPEYPWNLYHYFNDHAAYDMVKNYLFLHSNWVDNLLNLLRWISVFVLLIKYRKEKGYNYIFNHFVILVIFFLNPLTTSFISRMFASNVYYRAFESFFNVFTETILFGIILNEIWNKKFLRYMVALVLIVCVFYSQYGSLILKDPKNLYGYYIKDGVNVLPLYKIKNSELDVIRAFEKELDGKFENNKQVTVVSHVDGLRTFLPRVYQVFTARQYWSAWDRIDQDFYEVARLWYGWEERTKNIKYSKTCLYLVEYNIDYILNEIWENDEFDRALNDCTSVIYENYEFKLRKVIK